ncbi:hypothetical protein ZOSMA_246G00350 [Zostera marina]|uniref:Uncharacterized protein n=1 Tax=Zostera marina TaxID=29655 RepID=A0A0K9PGR1_ZOSMR|nr:hypothetical protein ZOSMA_246G00350 [Zostera marina]
MFQSDDGTLFLSNDVIERMLLSSSVEVHDKEAGNHWKQCIRIFKKSSEDNVLTLKDQLHECKNTFMKILSDKECNDAWIRESLTKVRFPVRFEDWFINKLGRVDGKIGYSNTKRIFPIGSLFKSEVLDGGDSGPSFKVTRSSCMHVLSMDMAAETNSCIDDRIGKWFLQDRFKVQLCRR